MSLGPSGVVALVLCVALTPCVSAGSWDCESYRDQHNVYHPSQKCRLGFCCGTCMDRYCCQDSFWRLSEDKQDDCIVFESSPLPLVSGIISLVCVILIVISCCICPCCCLYKVCHKPQPVLATTTHTTVVTSTPQQYPRQPMETATQPMSYQGAQYPPYQPVPVQPGYGPQPAPQGYGAQPMPTLPYPVPPFTAGPPPTYQEATGPAYPPNPMPYSQAAFSPDQPAYPLQPPAQPQQPRAVPSSTDYLAQPAYNPDYVAPPPKTG
ncbi:protein shisa-4-like [Brachionichthys hirsutus]|uniref:protein shisa-4-like n=1 Tax=Brachionichthys hirsutus TaxID=412623 RepID=UPI0036044CBD